MDFSLKNIKSITLNAFSNYKGKLTPGYNVCSVRINNDYNTEYYFNESTPTKIEFKNDKINTLNVRNSNIYDASCTIEIESIELK